VISDEPDQASAQVREMTEALDRGDADGFVGFFSEDASFRFANQERVEGRENIREAVAGALAALKGMHHTVIAVWAPDDEVILAEFAIDFTAADGAQITLPCVSVARVRDGAIFDYRINMDVAPALA
jgi:uncharacterized protein (TIGR02246 family)